MHKLILTVCATLAEGFAAHEVLPVVQNKFGTNAGMVFTAFIAIAIFYTWFLALNAESKLRRYASMSLAVFVFVPLTMISAYQAKTLPEAQARAVAQEQQSITLTDRQTEADSAFNKAMDSHRKTIGDINSQWRAQESSRIASLDQVNKEIKATKKLKQPKIYASLLDRQASLSAPYSRPDYPARPVREIIKPLAVPTNSEKPEINLVALQSLLLSVLTPIFLWLANGLPKTKKKRGSFTGSFGRWFASFVSKGHLHTEQAVLIEEPTSASYECPFEARRIITSPSGQVTVSNIRKALRISDRQARKRQSEAVERGYLVKKTNGYFYPEKPPFEAVKLRAVSS